MENLLYNISQVLGITIIHSLWQGLLIYFVLRLVLSAAPKLSSVKKYRLSAIALLGMTGWFVYTLCAEAVAYDWSPATGNYSLQFISTLNLNAVAHPDFKTTLYNSIKTYLPYVSIIYAMGLLINLSRLGIAWNKIRIIKKGMIAADNLQDRISEISRQINIKRYVKVSFSRLVDVPCVIGYFKPILLLPITLTFQLSAEEIETILLHELSHIKGNDYLVNLIQQIISVLLFFNPFAQFINNIISTERENRCDDMVVDKIGNPITYAYALLKLEEVRQSEVKLALAATQNKHHLLNRIERIMKTNTSISNIRPIVLAVLLIAGSLGSIAWLNPEIKNGKVAFRKIAASKVITPIVTAPLVITAPIRTAHVKAGPSRAKTIKFSYDTLKYNQAADTNKKKAKIKIVVEDENGNKHEYSSVNDMPESVRRDFEKENADMNFNMNWKMNDSSLNKFYSGTEWKKQVAALKDYAMAMSSKVNSADWKKQAETMKLQAEKMKKYYDSPEFKKQAEAMAKQAAKMTTYSNSPEMKTMEAEMEKQGKKMEEYYNSAEWKKQVEELSKQATEFGTKYFNSPEWKKMQEDMIKNAEEMGKYYSSPEWRKRADDKARMTDDEYRKKYGNEDDFAADTKTKAQKAKVAKAKATQKADVKPEAKEKKETPEKPEKKEVPEQKEAPEQKDAYNSPSHPANTQLALVDKQKVFLLWKKPGC